MKLVFTIIAAAFLSCNTNNENKPAAITFADSIMPIHADDTASSPQPARAGTSIPKERLIIPAISIGQASIDEKAESIAAKLGVPDSGDAAMGKAISTWISKSNKAYSTTIYFTTNFGDKDEASRVQQIRITSPFFRTKENIGVGSSIAEIKKNFPAIKISGTYSRDDTITNSIYDDAVHGIAFETDPAGNCIGVGIHKLHDKPFETYLAFFKNYTPVI